jgi:hypothetical protein
VTERKVEFCIDSTPNGYKQQASYAVGEHVPVVIDGVRVGDIPVEDIMPGKLRN